MAVIRLALFLRADKLHRRGAWQKQAKHHAKSFLPITKSERNARPCSCANQKLRYDAANDELLYQTCQSHGRTGTAYPPIADRAVASEASGFVIRRSHNVALDNVIVGPSGLEKR